MPPSLRLFRSVWGMPTALGVPSLIRELKVRGFNGVEASLGDVDRIAGGKANRKAWKDALGEAGLQHVVGVYSSWQDYEGGWEDKSIDAHVAQLQAQLYEAKDLNPVHVNCHSGQDSWDTKEAEQFFDKALTAQAEVGLACGVSHETHRGRILGDFSHWFIVSERFLYGTGRDRQLWRNVIPRTQHLHARVGGEQTPQHDDTKAPMAQEAREVHNAIWSEVFRAQAKAGKQLCTVTPEYGPPPYGLSDDTSYIAQAEASRIKGLFHRALTFEDWGDKSENKSK